jgi:hypothetical protein
MSKYADFLNEVVEKGTKSNFLLAMHERLKKGYALTENMEKALDDAISKSKPANTSVAKPKDTKTLKMRKWWVNATGIDSRVITVDIYAETERAFKVIGHADIVNGSWCMRCGRKLTQPASFTIGFGADCAEKIGLPYPKELNTMSEFERQEYKEKLLGILRNQTFEVWLPKSQIEQELSKS